MAKYEDYVTQSTTGGIDEEINAAQQQQQERQRDPVTGQFVADPASTPNVDWEERYKELEKLNSRQAQTLGEYRSTIDEFISSPTPESQEPQEAPAPITMDALYEDPNAAINTAVDNHPVVQEARAMIKQVEVDRLQSQAQDFKKQHPDFQALASSPEFQNWVAEDAHRTNLYNRSDQYDFSAADALFNWYKAEKGIKAVETQQAVQQAELVSSSGELVVEPPKYSRHEYVRKLRRSKQGDLECEEWIRNNVKPYRLALEAGNVRD